MSAPPTVRPNNPSFGSGPCPKRPGWSSSALDGAAVGRSHRSELGKGKLKQAIDDTHKLLGLPKDYVVGIVPASDTGAVEMVMWTMFGCKTVDVCHWESFGKEWFSDATSQLKLKTVNITAEKYGQLPDLSKVNPANDCIFTFNGTTSGVKVPNLDFISDQREGIVVCDATSAIFGMDMLPWHKMDVITYSWQKVLGGEGAHGMLILGPRAIQRLESYQPERPLPKIFRLTKKGKLISGIFKGETINTPSMLCVEDYLDALAWAKQIGGLDGLLARSQANFQVMDKFVAGHEWIDFLCDRPECRSSTSMTFKVALSPEQLKFMTKLLAKHQVAFDINSYRDAPAGLRIWGGATVEASDLQKMTLWLEWAYLQAKQEPATKAKL